MFEHAFEAVNGRWGLTDDLVAPKGFDPDGNVWLRQVELTNHFVFKGGGFWLGTAGGLWQSEGARMKPVPLPPDLSTSDVRAVVAQAMQERHDDSVGHALRDGDDVPRQRQGGEAARLRVRISEQFREGSEVGGIGQHAGIRVADL